MSTYSETTYQDLNTGVESAHNPKAIQRTYIDPNGATQVGYSIDNRMYKDEAGTQRIDNGSIVTNAAGTKSWVMTDAGGVEYGEYQKQRAIAAQPGNYLANAKASAMAAANQRLQADLAAIEQNRPQVNAQYDDLARRSYQGYMQSGKALANSLASQGLYNSGYSDTAKIAQTTNYRAQVNANERARLDALADLDHQINLARLNGSANLNELEAQYAQLLNEQANADRAFAYQQQRDQVADRRWQTEFDYNAGRDQEADRKWQAQFDYNAGRDRIADQRYDQEWAYQQGRDHVSDQRYNDEWAFAQEQWEYEKGQDKLAQENWQKEFDAAQAQVEWEQEQYKKKANTEATQRNIANAYAAAEIGDFSQLEALKIDTTNAKKLYEMEMQAMYQSYVGEGSMFGGSDVPATFDELYEGNKENYNQTIEYARSFAENQYTVPEKDFYSQLNNFAEYLEKTYGEGFGELYKEVVMKNVAELQAAAENATRVTFDDAETRVQEVLYGGVNGRRITDQKQLEQLVIEINRMDISNDDFVRLLAKYGLGEIWNSVRDEAEDANQR